jgi:hypothetical protein
MATSNSDGSSDGRSDWNIVLAILERVERKAVVLSCDLVVVDSKEVS